MKLLLIILIIGLTSLAHGEPIISAFDIGNETILEVEIDGHTYIKKVDKDKILKNSEYNVLNLYKIACLTNLRIANIYWKLSKLTDKNAVKYKLQSQINYLRSIVK